MQLWVLAEMPSDPLCKIMLLKQQPVLAFSNDCAQEGDMRLYRTKPLWWHFVCVVGIFLFLFCFSFVLFFFLGCLIIQLFSFGNILNVM